MKTAMISECGEVSEVETSEINPAPIGAPTMTTEAEVYCEACDEEIEGRTYDLGGDTLCLSCWKSNQADEARDQAEEAEGEVESIESEIADRKQEYAEALAALK